MKESYEMPETESKKLLQINSAQCERIYIGTSNKKPVNDLNENMSKGMKAIIKNQKELMG